MDIQPSALLYLVAILALWSILLSIGTAYTVVVVTRIKKKRINKISSVSPAAVEQLENDVKQLSKHNDAMIQKIGYVRFNPFKDVGGEQSFAVAILDGNGNGVVFSNLHSRTASRTYAKKVVAGKSLSHELSSEEERAIAQALAQNPE